MNRRSIITALSALGPAICGAASLVGCSSVPTAARVYAPSQAVLARTSPAPSAGVVPLGFELTLAAGDGPGVQTREAYLARAKRTWPSAPAAVIVLQSAP